MYKVKESIKNFRSYKPNVIDYDIKLDANESKRNEDLLLKKLSLNEINLYPDHYTVPLRKKIASLYNVTVEEVIVGSGSSELLELVTKTFINPKDIVLSIEPSFVMYKKYTQISGGIYESFPTNENYELNIDNFIERINKIKPKLIFLCTPNNPTGAIIPKKDVLKIIQSTDAIIVIDEAYMEFSEENQSVIEYIKDYPNLIVNRTFSKAYAIAGARLGYFISNKDMIDTLYIAKTPYSVTDISQQIGLLALSDVSYLYDNVKSVIEERMKLNIGLQKLGIKTFPSSTNFIFCKYYKADLKKKLEEKRILIRGFGNNTYRITVGTKLENETLLKVLEEIL